MDSRQTTSELTTGAYVGHSEDQMALDADPSMPFSSPDPPFSGSSLGPSVSSSSSTLSPALTFPSTLESSKYSADFSRIRTTTSLQNDMSHALPIGASSSIPRPRQLSCSINRPSSKRLSMNTPPSLPGRSNGLPRGPTHAYDLFAQSTVPVDSLSPAVHLVGQPIAITHSEDLPPYTRYPEGKSIPLTELIPIPPGAGGIGLATSNPQFDSAPPSPASVNSPAIRRSTHSDSQSHHEINMAAHATPDDDGSEEKSLAPQLRLSPRLTKWQRRANKRVCGIFPAWALVFFGIGMLVAVIVIGVIVAIVLRSLRDHKDHFKGRFPPDGLATNTWLDVIPLISVPSDLPSLMTGTFTLSSLVTRSDSSSCLTNPSQSQAWSCDVSYPIYSVTIQQNLSQPETCEYSVILTPFSSSNNMASSLAPTSPSAITSGSVFALTSYSWGATPPNAPVPAPMILVQDTSDLSQGPAWWTHVTYNKTVVIPQNGMAAAPNLPVHIDNQVGTDVLQPGDMPWLCNWPSIVLELYVYPTQNSSQLALLGSGSVLPSPSSITSALPSTDADTIPPPTTEMQDAGGASNDLITFPYVVKLKEHRIVSFNGSQPPTCQQVEVLDSNGGYQPVIGSDGQPVELVLAERAKPKMMGPSNTTAIPPEPSSCGCLWWVY